MIFCKLEQTYFHLNGKRKNLRAILEKQLFCLMWFLWLIPISLKMLLSTASGTVPLLYVRVCGCVLSYLLECLLKPIVKS